MSVSKSVDAGKELPFREDDVFVVPKDVGAGVESDYRYIGVEEVQIKLHQ